MKILYVLGRGRSGSTIFANVLGEFDGFFAAGEVRVLWDPVVVRGSACGCGAIIAECPVWSKVLDALSDVDVDQVVAWQHEIIRESNVVRLLGSRRRPWAALEGYARVTSRLYAAIAKVTACRVIVDSSKRPSYGALVRMLDGCEPYFVHLARDPRASAYSWRSRRYESSEGGGKEVRCRNAVDSTLRWDLLNVGSELLLRAVPSSHGMRIRYEDFVHAPRPAVERVMRLLAETSSGSPFVDDHNVCLGPNHTIAGNPSRFVTGRMAVQETSEWRYRQSKPDKVLATLVAAPFLRRYGYAVRGR